MLSADKMFKRKIRRIAHLISELFELKSKFFIEDENIPAIKIYLVDGKTYPSFRVESYDFVRIVELFKSKFTFSYDPKNEFPLLLHLFVGGVGIYCMGSEEELSEFMKEKGFGWYKNAEEKS